jgi:hypothetical protein
MNYTALSLADVERALSDIAADIIQRFVELSSLESEGGVQP